MDPAARRPRKRRYRWNESELQERGELGTADSAAPVSVAHLSLPQILRVLIKLYESLDNPDYFSITQCFVYLNDPSLASSLLNSLLKLDSPAGSPKEDEVLIAYQIAFDLAETATQEFLQTVRASLDVSKAEAAPVVAEGSEAAPATAQQDDAKPKEGSELHRERLAAILSGEESIKLYLEFLYRNNKADLLILKDTLVRMSCYSHLLLLESLTHPYPCRTLSSRATRSIIRPSRS